MAKPVMLPCIGETRRRHSGRVGDRTHGRRCRAGRDDNPGSLWPVASMVVLLQDVGARCVCGMSDSTASVSGRVEIGKPTGVCFLCVWTRRSYVCGRIILLGLAGLRYPPCFGAWFGDFFRFEYCAASWFFPWTPVVAYAHKLWDSGWTIEVEQVVTTCCTTLAIGTLRWFLRVCTLLCPRACVLPWVHPTVSKSLLYATRLSSPLRGKEEVTRALWWSSRRSHRRYQVGSFRGRRTLSSTFSCTASTSVGGSAGHDVRVTRFLGLVPDSQFQGTCACGVLGSTYGYQGTTLSVGAEYLFFLMFISQLWFY